MTDLRTRDLGLELRSPLVASASPLTGDLDGLRRLEDAGAVVLPSLFEEQVTHEAASARHASVEPVGKRFRHWLPWLLAGLIGAVAAADLLGSFGAQLQRRAGVLHPRHRLYGRRGRRPNGDLDRPRSVGRHRDPGGGQAGAADQPAGGRDGIAGVPAGRPLAVGRQRRGSGPAGHLLDRHPGRHGPSLAAAPPGPRPAFGSGPLATVVQDLLSTLIYLLVAQHGGLTLPDPGCPAGCMRQGREGLPRVPGGDLDAGPTRP